MTRHKILKMNMAEMCRGGHFGSELQTERSSVWRQRVIFPDRFLLQKQQLAEASGRFCLWNSGCWRDSEIYGCEMASCVDRAERPFSNSAWTYAAAVLRLWTGPRGISPSCGANYSATPCSTEPRHLSRRDFILFYYKKPDLSANYLREDRY